MPSKIEQLTIAERKSTLLHPAAGAYGTRCYITCGRRSKRRAAEMIFAAKQKVS
jgi:hypothetical protein